MNSRNDMCHDDSTINTVLGIIIIIAVIIIIIIIRCVLKFDRESGHSKFLVDFRKNFSSRFYNIKGRLHQRHLTLRAT